MEQAATKFTQVTETTVELTFHTTTLLPMQQIPTRAGSMSTGVKVISEPEIAECGATQALRPPATSGI